MMKPDLRPEPLIRWSALLAACGTIILVIAACFVALLAWHLSVAGGRGTTFVLVDPAPLALFVVGSAVVAISAIFVRHIAIHRRVAAARRLSHIAILGTATGWLMLWAALLWLQARHAA